MLAEVMTAAVRGVEAFQVRVEVNLSSGLPSFTVVGLAQGSVREGRERVAAALRNGGFGFPQRRITVNLAPADLRKEGTTFDLPIAVGVLAAAGVVPGADLDGVALLGELGLDGSARPVSGVLPAAVCCRETGVRTLFVPWANRREAALVPGLTVIPVRCLAELVRHLRNEGPMPPFEGVSDLPASASPEGGRDLADVKGQETAKRALEIAAAGGHNLLMIGPPGSGKTMLARRLPGILPPLTLDEALELARVQSVAGLLRRGGLLGPRPFRSPHHSVSYAGLVGGGSPVAPGEISLAHHGVLFLDEAPEYRRNVLEVLRQPLEQGEVSLSRAGGAVTFPARILLVLAMNPCPCGYRGDGSDRCRCDSVTVSRYRGRVSGPLLDRVDLSVDVPPVPIQDLGRGRRGESSRYVAARVERARARQTDRFRSASGIFANAHIDAGRMRLWCRPTPAASALLRRAAERTKLTARSYDRVLRVARTISDLSERAQIDVEHVAEALQFRLTGRD